MRISQLPISDPPSSRHQRWPTLIPARSSTDTRFPSPSESPHPLFLIYPANASHAYLPSAYPNSPDIPTPRSKAPPAIEWSPPSSPAGPANDTPSTSTPASSFQSLQSYYFDPAECPPPSQGKASMLPDQADAAPQPSLSKEVPAG